MSSSVCLCVCVFQRGKKKRGMWSGPPHHSSTEEGERAEDSAPVGQSQQPQASYSLASESRMNKTKRKAREILDGTEGKEWQWPSHLPRLGPPILPSEQEKLNG